MLAPKSYVSPEAGAVKMMYSDDALYEEGTGVGPGLREGANVGTRVGNGAYGVGMTGKFG